MRAVNLARQIAADHYAECQANKKLFEHRVENDIRLVGLSPLMVQLIIRIAVALFIFWISNKKTEVQAVLTEDERLYLELHGLYE